MSSVEREQEQELPDVRPGVHDVARGVGRLGEVGRGLEHFRVVDVLGDPLALIRAFAVDVEIIVRLTVLGARDRPTDDDPQLVVDLVFLDLEKRLLVSDKPASPAALA
jgi:hypothetical protein